MTNATGPAERARRRTSAALDDAARIAGLKSTLHRRELRRRAELLTEEVAARQSIRGPSEYIVRDHLRSIAKQAATLARQIRADAKASGGMDGASRAIRLAKWETAVRLDKSHPEARLQNGQVDRLWELRGDALESISLEATRALAALPPISPRGHGGVRRRLDADKEYVLGAIIELYCDLTGRLGSAGNGAPSKFQKFYASIVSAFRLPGISERALPRHVIRLRKSSAVPSGWLNTSSWLTVRTPRRK